MAESIDEKDKYAEIMNKLMQLSTNVMNVLEQNMLMIKLMSNLDDDDVKMYTNMMRKKFLDTKVYEEHDVKNKAKVKIDDRQYTLSQHR